MKAVFLTIFCILLLLVVSDKPKGVVEKLYSEDGLKKHYDQIFEKSDSTFGQQSLGSASDTRGWWWIFGQGMSVYSTYLDEYKLGDITKISSANLEYIFDHTEVSGTFKYRWSYRWYIIPFYHTSQCKFTLSTHKIHQKFVNDGGKFDVDRTIEYTSGTPQLDCTDSDQKQSTAWGVEWMKNVRQKYMENDLGNFFSEAIDKWLDKVDTIYEITSSAAMDKLTFTLGETLNDVNPDNQANLVLGYDYTIKYQSKSVTPVAHEDISGHVHNNDLTVYYYQEFFASLLELDILTIPFAGVINDAKLPDGIEFRMKAKDFQYIIDGMQKFSPTADMEADCGYSTRNSSLTIDTFITLTLPMSCKLDCGSENVLYAIFDLQAVGQPNIKDNGVLSLKNLSYKVLNFNASSPTQQKMLPEYLVRRIESYATLSQALSDIEYFDQRFTNMTNLSAVGDKQLVRVSGDFK